MLEKLIEAIFALAAAISANADAIKGNAAAILGGKVESPAESTTTEPAKGKPGRPKGSSPATQTTTSKAVTVEEITAICMPWVNGDAAKKGERGKAVNKVLDQYRSKQGQPLAEIDSKHLPAIFDDLKKLIDGDAEPAKDEEFAL